MKKFKEFVAEAKEKKIHIFSWQDNGRGATSQGEHLTMSHEDATHLHAALKSGNDDHIDDHFQKHFDKANAIAVAHENAPKKLESFLKGGKGFHSQGEEHTIGLGHSKEESKHVVRKAMVK